MKLFDMHIHTWKEKETPQQLIERLESVGLYGGCIISAPPIQSDEKLGLSFEERITQLKNWTQGYEDRLFSILWIHPYEENIMEKLDIAVASGVSGFKMICDDYYVYEEACLEVLRKIAALDKPVMFHSGILWDGKESSKYNRPVNWEALVNIPGLRFSLAHCSWPWIDECIALYGQFLYASADKKPAEMFFDTTPGTPEVYREDLIKKLYFSGYDTGRNILFGTDCDAEDYSIVWAEKWLKTDEKLMENMGVSRENFENLYYNNLMRFLGKTPPVSHVLPTCDNAGAWSPLNPEVEKIIEKWYKAIGFSKDYDKEFYQALKEIKISDHITMEKYDLDCKDGKRNFLSMLFLCEKLEKKYEELGISKEILLETVKDIVIYTDIWSDLKGELHLRQLDWLCNHLSGKLFRLGRLQFCMGKALMDIPEKDAKKGDPILEFHVPMGAPMTREACLASLEAAKSFFAKYFPDYHYKCFTAESWLLDDTLRMYLKPESNIIQFLEMFEPVHKKECDMILRYLFRWDTNSYNLKCVPAYNSFTEKVKQHILSGKKFYEVYGFLNEENL